MWLTNQHPELGEFSVLSLDLNVAYKPTMVLHGPPLGGGKGPPCFSKAPPLIYKGGAEGPPIIHHVFSNFFIRKIFPNFFQKWAASGQTLCQIASEHPEMCKIFRLRRANMSRISFQVISCFFRANFSPCYIL